MEKSALFFDIDGTILSDNTYHPTERSGGDETGTGERTSFVY